jgi:DnaA family protein
MNLQLPLQVGLRESSRFASYFAGDNEVTTSALQNLRAGSARKQVCVFIHGPTGTGKSHLLQAICAAASERQESSAYLPMHELMSLGPEVLSGCGELTYVCVDDVEQVAGHRDWERALFSLHQELDERSGQLVIAAAAPPATITFTLADLASRFAGGLVLTLHALDEAEQIAALQLRAHLRGFELPQDAALFLLRRLPRDMNSLCAFLDELDAASLSAQRRLTLPFVRETFANRAP